MARILVRHNKKYRLWCNTRDIWMSPLLGISAMASFLMKEKYEPHTRAEAYTRIRRTGKDYTKEHKKWLEEFFDNQYEDLCQRDKENRAYLRRLK